jgi:hypothetical protein
LAAVPSANGVTRKIGHGSRRDRPIVNLVLNLARNMKCPPSPQQPLQMLLTMRSSFRFLASIFSSLLCSGVAIGLAAPGARVPFCSEGTP